jgi:predicted ArsR family transcriptional regulator
MNDESLEEILEAQYDEAVQEVNESEEGEFEERVDRMVRLLQQRAYALGYQNGVGASGDAVNLNLTQEEGWNLARNLLYGAPITINISR